MAEVNHDKSRITTRVHPGVLDRIQEAADLTGATVNQFVVQSALERAEEVIARESVISMSRRDVATLLTMLDNPMPANEALQGAFKRFKTKVERGSINTTSQQDA